MNSYAVLRTQEFRLKEYELHPLQKVDIIRIREWRNAQIDVLRQAHPLTLEQQKRYYLKEVVPTFKQPRPKQLLFSFLKDDKAIGYGGLTNIEWNHRRAEISFLVDTNFLTDEVRYTEAFSTFLTLIKGIAFRELDLNRLFTETYAFRDLHIRILESAKFVLEGRMRQHVLIREQFYDSLIHGFLRSASNASSL